MSARLTAQRIPNWNEMQHKALHRTLALQRLGIRQHLHLDAGAVDLDGAILRVDHPRECSAIVDPFAHLYAQCPQAVRWRANFNYEIRTEMPVALEHLGIELADLLLANPHCVGHSPRTARKNESRVRLAGNSAPIFLGPAIQLRIDLAWANSRQTLRRRHYHQLPISRHLKEQFGVLGTEFGEFFIRHRMCRQDGRQKGFVDGERHSSILSPRRAAQATMRSDS